MAYPDPAQFDNLEAIDILYQKYMQNPDSIDLSWKIFFQGFDLGQISSNNQIVSLIEAYRRWGHLEAATNPLEDPKKSPLLDIRRFGFSEADLTKTFSTHGFGGKNEATLAEIVKTLRSIYSSRVGFEYMGAENEKIEEWFQSKIEPKLNIELPETEKQMILEQLIRVEALESFIHTRYTGQKRFSIEGGETLLPMVLEIIYTLSEAHFEEVVIGMAHRGRLNMLANVLQKPLTTIFQEFEDILMPHEFEGSSDVKYHKGFSVDRKTKAGKSIHVHLAANSSCLESVDPIVLGLTFAKAKKRKAASILIHGDASLAGQGVVYESLQFMKLQGYSTGGTVHVAVNNQIGFTTNPNQSRSTRYCTDIAKTFSVPVLHVNAEDPDACIYAARLAAEFKKEFGLDVFLDLICYRKYGHNEGDEPAYTQPKEYKIIRSKQLIKEIYLEKNPSLQTIGAKIETAMKEDLTKAFELAKKSIGYTPEQLHGSQWSSFHQPIDSTLLKPVKSAISKAAIEQVASGYAAVPADFHLHPKLQKFLKDRIDMSKGILPIDWGMAECLAFGSLLNEKISIRLSGQDSQRGTFSHRHAVWVDEETGSPFYPYARLGSFEVYNSPLSEFAVLGFEYGHSWAALDGLTIWEAQYGDFSIGAQTVIDHYIMAAEQKWTRYSNLILLLPHGYEGAGPEHSSARPERFLQLAALNNTQIVNCTTPAQYFHLLRRQALFSIKKPLIIFSPKSLLRSPACTSKVEDFTTGSFEEILADKKAKKAIFCTGKIYYELVEERKKRGLDEIAIHRFEQLYPVHEEKLKKALDGVTDLKWVQEEPENMGAWEFVRPYLQKYAPTSYAGRVRSGATATGSSMKHKKELKELMNEAFS